MRNKIIPYNPKLKEFARALRKNSTLSEVLFWNQIRNKSLGYQFHRQVPMLNYIVDFYCHELMLVIEIDGNIHDFTYENDSLRQNKIEDYGVLVVRFSNEEILNYLFHVIQSLEIIIKEREKSFSEK
ncbi:endonuclease domain-containing protein [Empedobacter sedimenti]|uniref:endonuclease domain-containing protein n=1 Tax=Empedobacter sedimenti TaxID=3042610 RepID=UPI0024A6960A|nr:DUF559 domain-containing protein [Empedobacter sedimenti]